MHRILLPALICLMFGAMFYSSPAALAASGDDPAALVKSWLDEYELSYVASESGGYALAFEGDNTDRVDIQIDFSDDFIHVSAPVEFIPDPVSAEYLMDIIRLSGSVPLIKPIIDDERFFYLTIDLPKAALSEKEIISDIALLVDFVDMNYDTLMPFEEE